MNHDELASRIVKRLDRIAPQNVELPALMIAGRAYGISELRAMSEGERGQWGANVAKYIRLFIGAVDSQNHNLILLPEDRPEIDVELLSADEWWVISIADMDTLWTVNNPMNESNL